MIQVQELRIGNYIQHVSGSVHVVEGVQAHKVSFDVHGFRRAARFEPIPITDEWLLKFGFIEYDDGTGYYYNSDAIAFNLSIALNTNNLGLTDIWCYTFNDSLFCVVDGYVHALQNLFYSITRNELRLQGGKPSPFVVVDNPYGSGKVSKFELRLPDSSKEQ